MKILLFGGDGQLGRELTERAQLLNFEIVAPVITEVDIANQQQVRHLVEQTAPSLIINCAAYTNVDAAESDSQSAYRVNRDGTLYLAEAAKRQAIRMIHVSTDYVFNGASKSAFSELDQTSPLNVYGRSKLEGERAMLEVLGSDGLVVRTSWLHGRHGANFVRTMIQLFKERDLVKVVDDQVGCPTWAGWLADVLLDLSRLPVGGVMHASNAGAVSWFGFAQHIFELLAPELEQIRKIKIEKQSTKESNRPATRPAYSVLDCSLLERTLGQKAISWQQGLENHLKDLGYLGGRSR